MTDDSAQVVVVGAGPVGLAAALLLAREGVDVLVLERRTSRSDHPKARGIRMRASELAAIWGLGADLRAEAMPDETHRFIYTESLAGEELARTDTMTSIDDSWGVVPPYRVPQDVLEAVLETHAEAVPGIRLRRGVAVHAVEQHDSGASIALDDGTRVRGEWVIAADGVGSGIRTALGVGFGTGGPTPFWQSVYWRGDLSTWTADRPAIMYYTQADARALVGVAPAGPNDRWITIAQNPPAAERPDPLTPDQATALVRRAVGVADLPVDVVSSETFRISADVAERYRVDRVFLAGDAAHSLPPTGGFGINTGFADVHNLAWKLALVLHGIAPDTLLDSYESERRPIAESNAAWATSNAVRFRAVKEAMVADDRDALRALLAEQQAHVDPVVQDLGFSYASLPDGAPPAFAAPALGARAPHVPGLALLEGFEGRMTLVVADAASPWATVAESGLELVVVDSDRYPLGAGAIIVRPDGHVGWMSGAATPGPGAIRAALAAIRTTGLAP